MSEKANYNLNLVWINKIQKKTFLCVIEDEISDQVRFRIFGYPNQTYTLSLPSYPELIPTLTGKFLRMGNN